ncbi:unnamed protein product [Parascedosporium putredinis]|uniref:Calcium-transporting ATPase n=2 Tax=Parascedosporium putredinis TaxID=1442378 RepID=A0A9P1MG01_9PEZI|nr:unnamed protein product [Parascedosporium putredinis]CAI8004531.1 unnamed protein product [Parascedosporium putredinis]
MASLRRSDGLERIPTITIDTAINPNDGSQAAAPGASGNSPVSPQEEGVSPATTTASELRGTTSFDSKDSRPTSPHNVSSALAPRAPERVGAPTFLSVPSNLRSRQNSLESDDAARGGLYGRQQSVRFYPGQMNKMLNPKSLPAFYKLGGLRGMEKGLQTDCKAGLSAEEVNVPKKISYAEAIRTAEESVKGPSETSEKLAAEGIVPDSKEKATDTRPSTGESYHSDDKGLFADRKRVFKDNRLPEKKGKSLLQLMWITYNDKTFAPNPGHEDEPRVEWVEGVAIIAAIVIVVVVGSLNDYSKERQFARLNRKKQDRLVKAVRSGKTQEISVFDILVGDVLHLEPGDLVPVDGILIQGFNVKCDESQATGESDIIKKQPADEVYAAIRNHQSVKKLDPFIQSGARVMEGAGTFMCTSTGIYSTYGRTLMALNEDPEITPLQSKLNVIATYIAKIGGAAGLLLFIVLFIKFLAGLPKSTETPAEKGQNFLEIFIVVVTIIVVAVPEGLPLAVTLALAFATNRMLKDNNLVRHLKACEVMGNATTICSDKTGTLTQNKMQVVAGTVGTSHRFGASEPGPSDGSEADEEADSMMDPSGDVTPKEFASVLSTPVKQLLVESIAYNSTAFEGNVDGEMTFIGSKTETALLLFGKHFLGMGPVSEERENATTLQLIPFDSGRKCMGIVVAREKNKARLYIKGASEIVLGKCTQMIQDPARDLELTRMTTEHTGTVNKLINHYASRGPRRFRRNTGDETSKEIPFEDLFHEMIFVGVVGIQDPLREGVPEAVRVCQNAGVVIRMVTGDNKMTAQAIAGECGILQPNSIVMEGPDPEDKRILVKRLKDKGEIVAVTGDGTNDAPALRMADVGFSMGIAGTEVAKEASSIILMDDNFNSIVKALKWGRAVNDAVKRFLQFQLTVNVTAVILTFVSAVANPDESSVLTAVQLLWIPRDSVLDRKPERRNASIISVTMWKMILGQAVYQLAITFLIYFGKNKVLPETGRWELNDETIGTLVFNTFVWMQIFNQWNNRRLDNEFNIFEGIFKNKIFLIISALMCGCQVLIVFVGGPAFKINTPPEGTKDPQGPVLWAVAIVLGFVSIPFGMVIRLIPDRLILKLVPDYLKRRSDSNVPGLTISDEEAFNHYPAPLADIRDELTFLKKIKGGRINNLKFAMRHPRETLMQRSRSPSHSRTSSIRPPRTPDREDSFGSVGGGGPPTVPASPDNRKRSRSIRSRSNSALGAPTVMAGIVAAGVAAGWSPIDRSASRDERGELSLNREASLNAQRTEE